MNEVPERYVEMGGRGIMRSLTMPEVEPYVLAARREAEVAILPVLADLEARIMSAMADPTVDADTDDGNAARLAYEDCLSMLRDEETHP